MKQRLAILFSALSVLAHAPKIQAADLVVSNNAIINILGDSMLVDQTAPCVGFRFPDFLDSYFHLNYPTNNIHVFNLGRSGGTMDDMITNNLQKNGLALWAYQFNSYQHIGISVSTDNGGLSSNQMFLSQSNVMLAPALMSDGAYPLVAKSGWASSNTVQWIGLGYIPEGADGSAVEQARNNAGTNAGFAFGIRGIDWWYHLAPSWTNDFNNNSGLNVGWPKVGHPGPGGQLAMTFAFLSQTTTDTNISTLSIDWNTLTPTTNHCVATSISKSGNVLSFNRLDDRLPFAWDYTNDFSQLATNDCSGDFILNPSDANFFQYTIRVPNCPAGSYDIYEDNERIYAGVSSTILSSAQGLNLFTNFIGPTGRQRQEVLGRIRDKEHVDRTTHIPGSAGDQQGMVSYESYAATYYATNNSGGDNVINFLSNRVANVMSLDALATASAQPTNHTLMISNTTPVVITRYGGHR